MRAVRGTHKTILSCFMGKEGAEGSDGTDVLRGAGIPAYRFPEEAAVALGAMNRYRVLRDRPGGETPPVAIDRVKARRALRAAGRDGWLPGEAAEAFLTSAGLPFAPSRIVRTPAAAIQAAHEMGYPIVLKAESTKLLHKSDAGGVKVDLRNADEVWVAFEDMTRRLRPRDPRLRIKVQTMVRGGREVILGMTRDPQYGALLMFGIGGIHVEVLKDVAVRVHPITDVQAREMIHSIRGFPLLAGIRGERPSDLASIESALLRLSALIGGFESVEEVDINPFIVSHRPGHSLIVDARVKVRAPLARPRPAQRS